MVLSLLTRPIRATREVYHSIDVLRGLAALSILVFHADHFIRGGGTLSRPEALLNEIWVLQLLDPLRRYGGLAVMLFWMISGFVFMNIYADTRPSLKTFWVNRFSRLYPLHLTTLVLIAGIQSVAVARFGHSLIYGLNDPYHFLLQLFFASEWGLQQGRSFNGPIWSVSVEILIYAIFYLFVRFVRINVLLNVAVLLGLATLYKLAPGSPIVLCGVFFFSGMLVYAVYSLIDRRARVFCALAATGGLALLAAGLAVVGPDRFPLSLWLIPIFGLALFALAVSESSARMSAGYGRLRFVGDITYSTYLWHSPLQMLFLMGAGFGWWSLDIAFSSAFMLAYFLFVSLFAYGSFLCLERPAQSWIRRRLLARTKPADLIAAP
jgi:peptidoglycan/LPS O-acetylase OafA/YrhL